MGRHFILSALGSTGLGLSQKLFYYVFPLGYYVRSFVYSIFINTEWEPCTGGGTQSAVCVNSSDGKDVLDALSRIFSVIESEDQLAQDLVIMLVIAMFWKIFTIVVIVVKTSKVATIQSKNFAKIVGGESRTVVTSRVISETAIASPMTDLVDPATDYEYTA